MSSLFDFHHIYSPLRVEGQRIDHVPDGGGMNSVEYVRIIVGFAFTQELISFMFFRQMRPYRLRHHNNRR